MTCIAINWILSVPQRPMCERLGPKVVLLGDGRTFRRWSLVGDPEATGVCPCRGSKDLSPFLLFCFFSWGEQFALPQSPHHCLQHTHRRLKAMGIPDHGLEPLKPRAKITVSLYEVIISGILLWWQEADCHRYCPCLQVAYDLEGWKTCRHIIIMCVKRGVTSQ
jgi:hypothetical protein